MSATDCITIAADTYRAQQLLSALEARYWDEKNDPRRGTLTDDDRRWTEIEAQRSHVAELIASAGGRVFLIPVENLVELETKIGKLNKRAAKLDVEPVRTTEHETIEVKGTGERKHEIIQKRYIAIQGSSPKLAGWQFVATLQHDEEGVILRALPTYEGAADLRPYRGASPENCDHCHKSRRRNDTYVIEHENGELKQVGSNCLADFLGGQDPARIATYLQHVADFLDEAEQSENEYNGPREAKRYDTLFYMTHVACMIRNYGWRARTGYDGTPTADAADTNMYNQVNEVKDRQGTRCWDDPTEADAQTAAKTIEWARALTESDLENDYLYNLYISLKGESLASRSFGLAASGVSAYHRAMERAIKLAARKQTKADVFLGEVKDKITVEVTISAIRWIEDRYSYNGGSKPLYIFVTPEGAQAKWFASRDQDWEVGDKLTIKGTVKQHEQHEQYGKSTVLTRCKTI